MAEREHVDELRPVDRLEAQIVVDNASDNLSSIPDLVQHEREVLARKGMTTLSGEGLCCAHWGLSLVLTAHLGDGSRTLLFDAGPEAYTFERNGQRLAIDFAAIDAVVLSHGHFDHAGGLIAAMRLIAAAKGGAETPLHLHPGMFRRRGLQFPDGSLLALKDVPKPEELARHGAEVVTSDAPVPLVDGAFWLSGEIPRVTPYEQGLPGHVAASEVGKSWEPDPWIMDERFVAVHVRDKGLVVFTACSHAGAINVLTEARARFPGLPLHAVMGGLHLAGAAVEKIIPDTVADLRQFGLARIVPCHCTGWRAVNALVNAFGEEVVVPAAVGRLYSF